MTNALTNKEGEVRELTEEDFDQAVPASDILPKIVGDETANILLKRKQGERGKQKAATKKPVSIRLSLEVLDYFKSVGKGWQTDIDKVLMEYVKNHGKIE